MRTGIIIMMLSLSMVAGDLVWKNGNPPSLKPDNPYLKGMNSAVTRAMHLTKNDKPQQPFFLVWGAVGEGSTRRNDPALRELAFQQYDAATLAREQKPSAFWEIYSDLEALNLWRIDNQLDKKQLDIWKERLRPSMEANIKSVTNSKSWINWAANTLLQSAAILELAATVYEQLDSNDKDIAHWREVARKNVERACEIQLPGGAFSYIRHSGPAPVYFNFDAAHLGRYYQLTGSDKARQALIRMTSWSSAATISGLLTPFSSPWWKHVVGTGGPYTGLEMAVSLADNPLAADVMAQRRKHQQPYVWLYGTMYSYTGKPAGDVSRNRCEMDLNSNGPALRIGGYDVEFPGCPWSDSSFGISISNEKGFTSLINAIYIAPNRKGESRENFKRSGSDAYIMVGNKDVSRFAGIVGENLIAGGRSFYAHIGRYGDIPPDNSPWLRNDVWYADADGAAGLITMECVKDDYLQDMEIWICSDKLNAQAAINEVIFPDFKLKIAAAELLEPYQMTYAHKSTSFYCFPFDKAGKRQYRKGEKFQALVSISFPNRPVLTAANPTIDADGKVTLKIHKDNRPLSKLSYDPGSASMKVNPL